LLEYRKKESQLGTVVKNSKIIVDAAVFS